MLTSELIALAILTTSPHLAPNRVHYLAEGILYGAQGDTDRAAALVVNGRRESSWRRAEEVCAVPGIGGYGAFGVADIPEWRKLYPGGTCGPIGRQARASAEIWGMHWRLNAASSTPARAAFGAYIGAASRGRHPEARVRAELFWRIRASLECACSI